MAKLDKKEVINNKNEAINKINEYLDNCIIQDDKHLKKANLLSFWLKDFFKYIEQEETFDSSYLKEYSRGDIIKVNLGFNVGNEEGGLHYCVVLDKKNNKVYSTLTVIPLSSLKENSKPNKSSIFLGEEIYESLFNKCRKLIEDGHNEIKIIKQGIEYLQNLPEDTEESQIIKNYRINNLKKKLRNNQNNLQLILKIDQELSQMKKGTIALINQITTISKQRIYNPKKDLDILSGIKLSDEKMKLIDEKIKKFYIN